MSANTGTWTLEDLPSLSGKLAVVTGANRGLGLEIVHGLAGAGAHVILACRDPDKAKSAVASVLARAPQAKVEAMALDLANLASVHKFAADFKARFQTLDILIHNAAVILVPKGATADGFEQHIGVNHLAPFALTALLMDPLRAAPAARVINMASTAHRLVKGIDLDDLHLDRIAYKPMEAYGRSKLAALLFTLEFDRRVKAANSNICVVTAHPGFSESNPGQGRWIIRMMTKYFAQPGPMGALPALYAASMPDVKGNDYWGPGGWMELRGHPALCKREPWARDSDKAAKLWALSEQLTGVVFPPI
jgi:NAD(P)-dependent dehydrogenase (short-subunit alcohol dehydrogenase family)